MTQRQLDRAVARQTGENLSTIQSFGFSIVEPPELKPLSVDWDELEAQRTVLFPVRQARCLAA